MSSKKANARRPSPRVLMVAGTRPECLKLASVISALRATGQCSPVLMNSGQHHAMVERTFSHLELACDLSEGQIDTGSLITTIQVLRERIREAAWATQATMLIAQGDTATAYATSLAANDMGVPLAHVEAGLRTHHLTRPFPEECLRRFITRRADIHFTPNAAATHNLINEGVTAARIHQVGNTIIDLLKRELENARFPSLKFLPMLGPVITLTIHRRENHGAGAEQICSAVREILKIHPHMTVVSPLHPNPAMAARIVKHLSNHPQVVLTQPLDYRPFIQLLARSSLVITDSGGIQEEAPHLGTPVLVVRENTERTESVACGAAVLVPARKHQILESALAVLAQRKPKAIPFTLQAPFGDGHAGIRIAKCINFMLT